MATATATPHPRTCRIGSHKPAQADRRWHLLHIAVLGVCFALLVRTFLLDTYHVPTGSMAPALLGHHRACLCPRCGFPVEVGLHPRDPADTDADPRCYRFGSCANCG